MPKDTNTSTNPNKMGRRTFIKGAAVAGGAVALAAGTYGGLKASGTLSSNASGKIVIIGGGAAGISMAARLVNALKKPDITLIDPSDKHFYQPGFTLIGGGVYKPDEVFLEQKDCIPNGVKWVKDSVVALDPENKIVITVKGEKFNYDFLVLTPGLVYDWDNIEGIDKNSLGQGNANCIYEYEGAIKTWEAIQQFVKKGGRGIFTDTYTKHKCGGAPKKICLLTEHLARKQNARQNLQLDFFTASKELYDVPFFTPRLLEIYKERNIPINLNTRITGIDTAAKKVYMKTIVKGVEKDANGKEIQTITSTRHTENYDFLHFLPPMGAPKFVKDAGVSVTTGSRVSEGWVDVDKYTLVHKKYPNIISFGDVSGVPTSKTSAAVRKQTPIAAENLIALMEGKAPTAKYNGYAACPIITDYGHVLLCEFDYDKKPDITFPFSLLDMSKEQYAAWLLKVYALKPVYFYGMLNGLM